MTYTNETLAKSLAAHLAPLFPGVTFYEDPTQQSISLPSMYLQVRSSKISLSVNDRYLRTIALDLVYLEDFNLPNLQQKYSKAGETLDYNMETFNYTDGTDTAKLRTYERNARIDLDACHYYFELRLWVRPVKTGTPMQTMTYQEEILNGKE